MNAAVALMAYEDALGPVVHTRPLADRIMAMEAALSAVSPQAIKKVVGQKTRGYEHIITGEGQCLLHVITESKSNPWGKPGVGYSATFKHEVFPLGRIIPALQEGQGVPEELEPVGGDMLPAIGSTVQIHLARQDAWVDHAVVGYYVWPAQPHQVKGDGRDAHRVFVRVKDSEGYLNARLLSEVRAAAPKPQEGK